MRYWFLALVTAVVTAILVGIAAASSLRAEGLMVAAIAVVFLVWAALWSLDSRSGRRGPIGG